MIRRMCVTLGPSWQELSSWWKTLLIHCVSMNGDSHTLITDSFISNIAYWKYDASNHQDLINCHLFSFTPRKPKGWNAYTWQCYRQLCCFHQDNRGKLTTLLINLFPEWRLTGNVSIVNIKKYRHHDTWFAWQHFEIWPLHILTEGRLHTVCSHEKPCLGHWDTSLTTERPRKFSKPMLVSLQST
jgi:hypothetical protein